MTASEKTLPAMPLPSDSLWARLRATPLGDMLRGRLTGRRDFRRVISAANLREPLPGLIYWTVRKTRLWRRERVDVARELADHFRDGSDAGRTPDELLKSFGDPRQAARLIRRAKLRSRPLAWRIYRRALQAVSVLLVLGFASYLVLFIRYVSGRPTISRNYVVELNAAARAVPEADRAWPLYREALLRLTREPSHKLPLDDQENFNIVTEKPGDKHWPLVAAWLAENRGALQTVRQAAARPRMGLVYGDPADVPLEKKAKIDPNLADPNDNGPLTATTFPFGLQQETGQLLWLLVADAHRAVAENDRRTVVEDVEAAVAVAGHILEDSPFLLTELVSFHEFNQALNVVDEALAQRPDLLNDADLKRLAHSIAGYAGAGTIHCRMSGEKMMYQDAIQRVYTDDGHGDGRLTRITPAILIPTPSATEPSRSFAELTLGPLVSAVAPSRRAMAQMCDELYDRAESEFGRPLWQWTPSTVEAQIKSWRQSPVERIRYILFTALFPAVRSASFAAQRITQQRDATLVALALELYHRRHGSWPEKLDALVPDLLPAVPPDRFTGGPMLYRIVDGRPLLYSAGPDRKDDGGRSVADTAEIKFYPPPGSGDANAKAPPDGDWILWPPQEERKK